ncbi:MAG: LPS export ABC transporter permease LptF [Gammaproteobacteria bacterium]|nr:LPS export ABC transporter permease LptF [Gammaproteobacteria bacterium]
MPQKRFSIIDRYIARELLFTWLAVTLVLMLILLSSTLARLLGKAADGSLPSDAVLPLLAITSARYLILLIPLSLYLSVLLSFSRMYKDNEMAAMAACGIGLRRLYRPLVMVVVPVCFAMLGMTLYAMPWVSQQGQLIKAEIENRSELSGLAAGRFNESRHGDAIMFLENQSDDGRNMENVFFYQSGEVSQNVETAALARRYTDEKGRKFMLFVDGYHYQGQPGQSNYRITKYEKHGIYTPEAELVQQISRRGGLPTSVIWNSAEPQHRAEMQWRLSIPLATFVLALLALPLSYTTPRKGRYSKLAVAILIYLIFSNLLGVGQTWVEQQKVPYWLGIWWVHGLAVLLFIFLLIRRAGGIKRLFFKPEPRLESA